MTSENEFYEDSNSGSEWGTPPYIVEPLSEAINGFDLDPASGAESVSFADTRYTKEENGLIQDWFGDVWLNPPYGRGHNEQWAKKKLITNTEVEMLIQ